MLDFLTTEITMVRIQDKEYQCDQGNGANGHFLTSFIFLYAAERVRTAAAAVGGNLHAGFPSYNITERLTKGKLVSIMQL